MVIVRVGGRGTSRRVEEKKEDNWSGGAFKKSLVTLKVRRLHQQRDYGLVLEEVLEKENYSSFCGDINSINTDILQNVSCLVRSKNIIQSNLLN
jgi:hypothetical protein